MKLSHARVIVQEPRYVEALKVIAEAEAARIESEIVEVEPIAETESK